METEKSLEQPKIIDITNYKQKKLGKAEKYSLRKIATIGLTSVGLIAAIALLPKLGDKKELASINQIEASLDENETDIASELGLYSIALQEYENIIDSKNHSEIDEIEKRMNLVTQTRNLVKIADKLMTEKVKEAFELENSDAKASVQRTTDAKGPIDCINVEAKEQEFTYYSLEPPKEMTNILNQEEEIKIYQGSGENSAWNKEMNTFIKRGTNLYNSIVDLLEKDFYLDNNILKAHTLDKNI